MKLDRWFARLVIFDVILLAILVVGIACGGSTGSVVKPSPERKRCPHVYAVDALGARLPLDPDGTYHVASGGQLQFKNEWIPCTK